MDPKVWWDRLTTKSDDWEARSGLAQQAQSDGNAYLAECLRWQIAHRKRPYHAESTTIYSWRNADILSARSIQDAGHDLMFPFNADTIFGGPGSLGDEESDLPGVLYSHLTGGNDVASHRQYPTLQLAEEALHAAWAAAREAGWQPQG
jgi:hypothetical protein